MDNSIKVLYSSRSVAIFLLALLLGLCTSGASWWWCCRGCDCWQFLQLWNMLILLFFQAYVHLVSCYGQFNLWLWNCHCLVWVLQRGLWVIFVIRRWLIFV